jgi:hypothetical protein
VNEETVLLYCNDKGRVRRDLDLLRKRRGGPPVEEHTSPLKLNIMAEPGFAQDTPPITTDPNQIATGDSAVEATVRKRRVIQPRPQMSSGAAPASANALPTDATANPDG